jgi:hypothetical protein
VKNNKVKIIIITSIVAVVVIIAIVLTAILIQPDPIPLPEEPEDPVVSTYDPYVDIDAKVQEINEFYATPILMSTYMKDRVVVQNLEIEDSVKNSPVKLPTINVEEVLFSDNVTKIRYEYDKETYIFLKDTGYYVINEKNKNQTFDFKAISVPDLSQMPRIKSDDIVYSEGSNTFIIRADYIKKAMRYLLLETNILSNFTDKTFTDEELETVISKTKMTGSFKIDENKKINYFKFSSSLTRNDQEANIINLLFEKTDEGLTLTIQSNLNEQVQYKISVTKQTEDKYRIRVNVRRYSKAGEMTSDVVATCTASYVEDSPFEYQEYLAEQIKACDHILDRINLINKYKQVSKVSGENYCEKLAVYDTDLRAYALFSKTEDGLIFDGMQLFIAEDQYCMCVYDDSKSSNIHLKVKYHAVTEEWHTKIQEKYAAGVAVDEGGRYLDKCEYLRIYDTEYNVYVLLKKHKGLYYLLDYNKKSMVDHNICIGSVDYTNNKIFVTDHCEREQIEERINKKSFYLAGKKDCEYIACKMRDFYIIFYYDGQKLTYLRTQMYAEGMCRGTLYLDTGRVVVDEYNHKCIH